MADGRITQAEKLMERARHAALALNHSYLGTEHVLVAYLSMQRGGEQLHPDLTAGTVTDQILALIGDGVSDEFIDPAPLPEVTRALQEAVNLAWPQAVEPVHILRAIIKQEEGVGCQIIVKLTGANLSELRLP